MLGDTGTSHFQFFFRNPAAPAPAILPVCGAPAAFCSVFFFIDPPKNEQAALPPAGIRFTVQLIVV